MQLAPSLRHSAALPAGVDGELRQPGRSLSLELIDLAEEASFVWDGNLPCRCRMASCGSRAPKSCASWQGPRTSWGEASCCGMPLSLHPSAFPTDSCGCLRAVCGLPRDTGQRCKLAGFTPACPLASLHFTCPICSASHPSHLPSRPPQSARARPDCGQSREAAGRPRGAARPLLPYPAQRQERGEAGCGWEECG